MKKVSYSDKVKKASAIHTAIVSMKQDDKLEFYYRGDKYKVKAYSSWNDEMSYSIWNSFRGMNVNKIGKTSLSLYTYDMMSQKTTYRMSLLDIEYGE